MSNGKKMKYVINKLSAIIIKNNKLLLVRKKNSLIYISPGGKSKKGETHIETLEREVKEEVDLKVVYCKYFGGFSGLSAIESLPINMEIYYVVTKGIPKPNNEIVELLWIGSDYKKIKVRH